MILVYFGMERIIVRSEIKNKKLSGYLLCTK